MTIDTVVLPCKANLTINDLCYNTYLHQSRTHPRQETLPLSLSLFSYLDHTYIIMSVLMTVAMVALVAIAVLPAVADPEERREWRERFVAFVTCQNCWWRRRQRGDAADAALRHG